MGLKETLMSVVRGKKNTGFINRPQDMLGILESMQKKKKKGAENIGFLGSGSGKSKRSSELALAEEE